VPKNEFLKKLGEERATAANGSGPERALRWA
jgi:hypothetical protein